MKAPSKPKKPSKNQAPPEKKRWVEYNIFFSDSEKSFKFTTNSLTDEEIEDCDLYLPEYIDKKLISAIQDKFGSSIDYRIQVDYWDGEFNIRALEEISEKEYSVLLEQYQDRFIEYEKKLKAYEIEKQKYEEFKKADKLDKLKKQLKELEKANG